MDNRRRIGCIENVHIYEGTCCNHAVACRCHKIPSYLKVPGEWLKACGHGSQDRVFRVLRVDRGSLFGRQVTFATVDRDGKPWVIHVEVRGAEFVPPPN